MTTGQPNRLLEATIDRAGCSYAGLARRVNQVGADHGLTLRYDHTAVTRWVRGGARPRGVVPHLIAEALSEYMGRLISVDEIDMADTESIPPNLGLVFAHSVASTVETVTELWRSDVNRRKFLLNATFAASAPTTPCLDWLVGRPDEGIARSTGHRVGAADVEAIRATTRMFDQMDHQFGGGYARTMAIQYLDSEVGPKLLGAYSEEVGRALYGAAAMLTELVGWMAYDMGLHGVAQRYFIQALRLAHAGDDRAYGAFVLTSMGNQAIYLGHHDEALRLARAASHGAATVATPTLRTECALIEARAHALLGDTRSCLGAVRRAERAYSRARADSEPDWMSTFDEAVFATYLGACHRDLGNLPEAERHTRHALGLHDTAQVRRRSYGNVQLASVRVRRRQLEEACGLGTEAARLAAQLKSARSIQNIRDLRSELAPYADERPVREFDEAAAELLAARA